MFNWFYLVTRCFLYTSRGADGLHGEAPSPWGACGAYGEEDAADWSPAAAIFLPLLRSEQRMSHQPQGGNQEAGRVLSEAQKHCRAA